MTNMVMLAILIINLLDISVMDQLFNAGLRALMIKNIQFGIHAKLSSSILGDATDLT